VVGLRRRPASRRLTAQLARTSPYATAVLKHLDAMAGTEFGVVMRMITEEVR
jgi:hypothetical protein